MDIGFEGSPITQSMALSTLITSLLTMDATYLSLNLYSLYRGQIWRLLTSHSPFANTSQLIIGIILMYNLRMFEKFMGSRKFGAHVFLSLLVSTLSSVGLMAVCSSMDVDIFPAPGPFFFIYSLLPLFYSHVPRLHSSKYIVLGFTFSEKSWIYLLATQLAFSNGLSTVLPALSGIIAGAIYSVEGLGLQQFRLPSAVYDACSRFSAFVGSFFAAPAPAPPRRNAPAAAPAPRNNVYGARDNFNFERDFPPIVPAAPSEEAIATLMGMGFNRTAVVNALQRANNSIEAAADWLLTH